MTSWNEFRANEQAKIAIWQIPPAYNPPGISAAQANNLTAARMEGPRLIVPWTDFTIFGDHRGASYSNIVNDVFEGTPLTGGKSAQDGFLFVVYYPSADIVWLRFVHVNDEATMPVAYTPALKSRFRFYLNGIPTSAQILAAAAREKEFPPMSFGEEFFIPLPSNESTYTANARYLRQSKVMETGTPPTRSWSNVHTHPDFSDTIYYKDRGSRSWEAFRGEGTPTWSPSINPSAPWPAEAQGRALLEGIKSRGMSPYLYAKPVVIQKSTLNATFQSAVGGQETREPMDVYTLDTSAGDYALLYTARNASEILRFYTAGPTIVTPTPTFTDLGGIFIPTFGLLSGDDDYDIELADIPLPPPPMEEDPEYLPPGGYEEEEEETSSGLTGSLPLILGVGAAAAYFLLNR